MIYDQPLNAALDKRLKLRVRYSKLYSLLKRVCIEHTAGLTTDFSNLFSRLYYVCKHNGVSLHDADRFRRNARMVLRGKSEPTEEGFEQDVAALRQFLCALTGDSAGTTSSNHERPLKVAAETKVARGVVTSVGEVSFHMLLHDEEAAMEVTADEATLALLSEGARVNVINGGEWVILEPDFLIDVSSLTACVRPYGTSALQYLLSKFQPRQATRATMLGNAANQFMDDCINSDDANFTDSMRAHFKQSLLDYACYERPEEIDKTYFAEAAKQFENIRRVVNEVYASPEVGIALDDVLLEPSFICPTLGLRGRLDVMTADHLKIVELKSGKAEDFRPPIRSRSEHLLQMALYREMLHYNFGIPRDAIGAFLLYSRYPLMLADRVARTQLAAIIHLRNEIVHQEMRLRNGEAADILKQLTPSNIITTPNLHPNFIAAIMPAIQEVTSAIEQATSLERNYLTHFVTFLAREQFLSKMGEPRPDSTRGFARVWNADLTSKIMAGEILINLQIQELSGEDGIDEILFSVPDYGEKFIADFSEGDMVQLYERSASTDGVANRQLVRGYIVKLTDTELRLHLTYKQRNLDFFSKDSYYAIEKDSTDSGYASAYRGLLALLKAPKQRKELLLGLRTPQFNADFRLRGDYGVRTNNIVRSALSAEDYYLLVGPPGTGKTNVALRAMVMEFLAQACMDATPRNLLLTAYTNRAVDEICHMLQQSGVDFLRLGIEQTCDVGVRPNLLSNRAENLQNRQEVAELLRNNQVVVGTIATLTAHTELFNIKHFDLAIIDEASQVLEPQAMPLLAHPHAVRRFVMIGDHKQLPAVVMQRPEQTIVTDEQLRVMGLNDLHNSLFERLHNFVVGAGMEEQAIGFLQFQGRMHCDIARFVNLHFYDNQLQPVPLEHQEEVLAYPTPSSAYEAFVAQTRMGFVHVAPEEVVDNVKANRPEAEVIAKLVEAIVALNLRAETSLDIRKQVGVIVPFRNQISMIRARLREIGIADADEMTIDTVECYQGSQRDYILFTTTISQPYQLDILSSPQQVEGVSIDRKLNVAITRARKQFFLVGNKQILTVSPIYRALIAACDEMPCATHAATNNID